MARFNPSTGAEGDIPRAIQGLGQNIEQAGNMLFEEHQRVDKLRAEDALNVLRQKQIDLAIGEDGFGHKLGKDAITGNLEKDYGSRFQATADELSGQLANDQQRRFFSERANVAGIQLHEKIAQHVFTQGEAYSQDVFKNGLAVEQQNAVLYANDPNAVAMSLLRSKSLIAAEASRNGLGDDWKTATEQQAAGAIHSAIVQKFLADDQPTRAQAWLDKNKDQINAPHQLALRNAVHARLQENAQLIAQDEAQLMAKEASDLELSVRSGKGDPKILSQQIDNAFTGRAISGPKRTELHVLLDEAQKKEAERQQNLAAVNLSLVSGIPLDWKNEKQVKALDDTYKSMVGDNPFTPEAMSATALMVKNTAIVPTPVRSLVRSLARSGSPDHAVAAAELVSRINEASPQALETIPADERAFSLMVSESVAAGMDRTEAVNLARQRVYQTSPEETAKLKSVYDAKDFKKDNLNALNSGIDKNFDTFFRSQPDAPPQMQAEFDSLTRDYFVKTNNPDQARTLAWRDMARVWGVTDINGGGLKMMKYSPEKLFGDGQPNKWMRKQLEDEVRQIQEQKPRNVSTGTVGGEPSGPASSEPSPLQIKVDPKSLQIVADDITARSRTPTYAVLHQRPDGLFEPILDDRNQPLRWHPDYRLTAEGKKQIEEQQQTFERAKKARADLSIRRQALEDAMRGLYVGQ
jgi:hypothetical protein